MLYYIENRNDLKDDISENTDGCDDKNIFGGRKSCDDISNKHDEGVSVLNIYPCDSSNSQSINYDDDCEEIMDDVKLGIPIKDRDFDLKVILQNDRLSRSDLDSLISKEDYFIKNGECKGNLFSEDKKEISEKETNTDADRSRSINEKDMYGFEFNDRNHFENRFDDRKYFEKRRFYDYDCDLRTGRPFRKNYRGDDWRGKYHAPYFRGRGNGRKPFKNYPVADRYSFGRFASMSHKNPEYDDYYSKKNVN